MCLFFQLLDCTGELFEQQRTMHLFLASLQHRLKAAPQGLMYPHLLHPTHRTLYAYLATKLESRYTNTVTLYAAHMSTLTALTVQMLCESAALLSELCMAFRTMMLMTLLMTTSISGC